MPQVAEERASLPNVILAVLATIAALYWLKAVLVPIALALTLACILAPAIDLLRKVFRLGSLGAAVLLFLLMTLLGLYGASLVAESLVQAAYELPMNVQWLAGKLSARVSDLYQDMPFLQKVLPDPKTIDLIGTANAQVFGLAGNYLDDLTLWIGQGFVVLVLVLFILAEGEMLAPKAVRFFVPISKDDDDAQRTLRDIVRKIRTYLIARTLINIGVGLALASALWMMNVQYAAALGMLAGLLNYVPYLGQFIGGLLPMLVVFAQTNSLADVLIVAAIYLAILTIDGYVITPWVLGKSLDLNGTTILVACLFWWNLWGIIGLILAMPITASIKLIFQHLPAMHAWADLMSNTPTDPRPGPALAPGGRDIGGASPPAPAPEPNPPAAVSHGRG